MKLLRKSLLSAAVLATMALASSPVYAVTNDAVSTPFNAANNICAGGAIGDALAGLNPSEKGLALGEALRQVNAGQCPGTTKALLDAAKTAEKGKLAAEDAKLLEEAFAAQSKPSAAPLGPNSGVKGFSYDEDEVVEETLVGVAAGEAVSKK